MVGLAVLDENESDIHLSAIIAKSTNRLLNSNRFCVDKSKKYIFTIGCQVHKLVLTTLLVIQLLYLLVYNRTC